MDKLEMEESMLVIGLHRIVSKMDKETKRICKRHSLSLGQFMVLEALDHKGSLTVGEVKDYALSSDGTIPVITGNLEKMGYITKLQDEKDKRRFMLEITPKGREIVRQVYPENNRMLSNLLEIWTKEEKKTLVHLIRKYRSTSGKQKSFPGRA